MIRFTVECLYRAKKNGPASLFEQDKNRCPLFDIFFNLVNFTRLFKNFNCFQRFIKLLCLIINRKEQQEARLFESV